MLMKLLSFTIPRGLTAGPISRVCGGRGGEGWGKPEGRAEFKPYRMRPGSELDPAVKPRRIGLWLACALACFTLATPALAQEEGAAAPDCTVEWRGTHQMMELWFRAVVTRNCELAGEPGPICNGPMNQQVMEVGAYIDSLEHSQPEEAVQPDFDTYVREGDILGAIEEDIVFQARMGEEMNAQTPPPVLMEHYATTCPQEAPEE